MPRSLRRWRLLQLLALLLVAYLLGAVLLAVGHDRQQQQPPPLPLHQGWSRPSSSLDLPRLLLPATSGNSASTISACQQAYLQHTAATGTSGLTRDDWDRSRALVGNRRRLAHLAHKLTTGQPTLSVVCGGSITLAHGVTNATNNRYSQRLEAWLNEQFPVLQQHQRHVVVNKGSHGADVCAMSKRLALMMQDLKRKYSNNNSGQPELIVLEFAVNDYQGQDHRVFLDHKTDVFFQGFERIALCAETVVYQILTAWPRTAVLFLEFQTAIEQRKTAALLHMGVAKHYQIPVISHAETLFPYVDRLRQLLQPFNYAAPTNMSIHHHNDNNMDPSIRITTAATAPPSWVLPYPHGCSPCRLDAIAQQFRYGGCKSLCVFAKRSGHAVRCETDPGGALPQSMIPCYLPFFAHDAVHPSLVGHQIASDLLAHAIAMVVRDTCRGLDKEYPEFAMPPTGFLVDNPQVSLQQQNNFVMVQDTMEMFGKKVPLNAFNHTAGFALRSDGFGDRFGWIAENSTGGESITFRIDLPRAKCYAIYLAALHSYEHMGIFSVTVTTTDSNRSKAMLVHQMEIDALWEPRISIPKDVQVTPDELPGPCTGKCAVTVTTHKEIDGRGGNKVKLMTLSARPCTNHAV